MPMETGPVRAEDPTVNDERQLTFCVPHVSASTSVKAPSRKTCAFT